MRAFATICVVAAVTVVLASSAGAVERDFEGVAITSSASSGGPVFPPTLDDIQVNVFTPSCALSFCHGSSMQAGLHLEAGFSYASLVNVPALEDPTRFRVEPFDPDNSYIICKLEACPTIIGQQMPLVGGPLSQSVIDVIRQWILLGAPQGGSVSVDQTTWGQVKSKYR